MQPFSIIVKPAGAACNLDCRYCFFTPKAALYPGSSFRMEDHVLETCLEQVLAAHPGPEVVITWQGGEPTLMGVPFFERAFALGERLRGPGQQVKHTFQTNGVLVDDRWASFFHDNQVLVGLSIDGPEGLHDPWRVDHAGHGSHARVVAAWDTMARQGVDVNVLCCVQRSNADHPLEVYRYFRDELGARFIQFIPIVERAPGGGAAVSPRSVLPGQYGRFLAAVYDEWVCRDVGEVFVQSFDAALASWVGQPSLCVFCAECGAAPVIEHTGDVYACDHFVEPAHLLGNVLTGSLADMLEANVRGFGADKAACLPGPCRTCDVVFLCQGECPRNRFVPGNGDGRRLNYLCADYLKFFHHVAPGMDLMARLLEARRPPRDAAPAIVSSLAALGDAVARAGRNDPCPCGSGLKTKRCHGEA